MKVPASFRGERIDRAIQRILHAEGRDVSVQELKRAIREGRVLIDQRRAAPGDRVRGGEEIDLSAFVPRAEAHVAPDGGLLARAPIVYEDDRILVLDKPSGVPPAPLEAQETGTLLAAAIARCPAIENAGPPLEGGLLHRLDIGTSGVIAFAKSTRIRDKLRAAFSARTVEKRYLAIVHDPGGVVGEQFQTIEALLASGPGPERMHVAAAGERGALDAKTDVRALEHGAAGRVLIEAVSRSGRRHQIRVHLASLGAPIAGDRLYEPGGPSAPRLCLHAAELLLPGFPPIVSPFPADLRAILNGDAGVRR